MYAVCHSRSSTLYQADNFLLGTRRRKMPLPGPDAPDLREEGSSNAGSDGFHSLVQQAVADSMASVTMQISSLIDSRFDNFKKQFTEENLLWLLPGTWSRPYPPRLYGFLALLFSVEILIVKADFTAKSKEK